MFSYVEMTSCWHEGLKNGNWYRLGSMEKTFYRAATSYARLKHRIVSSKIIVQLKIIAEKLKVGVKGKIISTEPNREGKPS